MVGCCLYTNSGILTSKVFILIFLTRKGFFGHFKSAQFNLESGFCTPDKSNIKKIKKTTLKKKKK